MGASKSFSTPTTSTATRYGCETRAAQQPRRTCHPSLTNNGGALTADLVRASVPPHNTGGPAPKPGHQPRPFGDPREAGGSRRQKQPPASRLPERRGEENGVPCRVDRSAEHGNANSVAASSQLFLPAAGNRGAAVPGACVLYVGVGSELRPPHKEAAAPWCEFNHGLASAARGVGILCAQSARAHGEAWLARRTGKRSHPGGGAFPWCFRCRRCVRRPTAEPLCCANRLLRRVAPAGCPVFEARA